MRQAMGSIAGSRWTSAVSAAGPIVHSGRWAGVSGGSFACRSGATHLSRDGRGDWQ